MPRSWSCCSHSPRQARAWAWWSRSLGWHGCLFVGVKVPLPVRVASAAVLLVPGSRRFALLQSSQDPGNGQSPDARRASADVPARASCGRCSASHRLGPGWVSSRRRSCEHSRVRQARRGVHAGPGQIRPAYAAPLGGRVGGHRGPCTGALVLGRGRFGRGAPGPREELERSHPVCGRQSCRSPSS